MHPSIARVLSAFLGLIQSVVLLVLIVACVNLANLMLVRVSARERELSLRRALGASRWRIAAVLLAESILIAVLGGVLGVVLGFGTDWALQRIPLDVGIPAALRLGVDARVLAFALGATVLTTLAFGAGPAIVASRAQALDTLRSGSATATRRSGRLRGVLVGAQVAISAVLLFGCGLMVRSLYHSRTLDPGFDAAGVQLFAASPEQLGYDETRGRALWRQALERASRVPGVTSAALALMVPLGNRGDVLSSGPVAAKREAERPPRPLGYNYVSPGYFATLRISLEQGRDFASHDDRGAPEVGIVSTTMAREFFGREPAIGRQIRVIVDRDRERRVTIIGVAGDVKLRTLGEPPAPMLYLPFGQWYRPDMILHVRVTTEAPNLAREIVGAMHSIEPNLAVDVQTMRHATAFSLIPVKIAASVLGFAGVTALALAILGVFGVVAYAVSVRTREIGIRVALGAERVALARFVARHGLWPVVIGVVVALPLAIAAGSLLRGMLIGMSAADPVTLGTVILLLLASGGSALLLPLRRALRVDPARALRED